MGFKFLKNKKRKFFLVLVIILFLAGLFFVSAYVNGKDVSKDISIQWISHTEYWRDDVASTIIRIADYRGNSYDVDSCVVNILYPDKTLFVGSGEMLESNIEGNWYRTDSLEGAPLGTYEQEVICVKGTQTIKSSQSFHLNPALEEVDSISQNLDFARSELSEVNVSLKAKVQETGEEILLNLNMTEATLSDLIEYVGGEIQGDINTINSSLNTHLDDIEVSLNGELVNTRSQISLEVSAANESISNLLVNNIRPALETKIEEEIAALMAQVSEVNVSLTGVVESTGESINVNVDAAKVSISDLVNNVESNLISEIDTTEANLDTSLENVHISLTNSLGATETLLSSELSNVNGSISALLTQYIKPELESLMTQQYNSIMDSVSNVYDDTQWLVTNAMNVEDMSVIESRFSSIDSNLNYIIEFCSDSITNSSALCQEIYVLKDTLKIMRQEQLAYFNSLNETTYNTWQLLSGDIHSGINNILLKLNLIQEQTEEINDTTHKILDEIQGEVQANIIS